MKTIKHPYRLALVYWEDIMYQSGWRQVPETKEIIQGHHYSVSWVVRKDDKYIWLSNTYRQGSADCIGDVWQIPIAVVKKITYIKL